MKRYRNACGTWVRQETFTCEKNVYGIPDRYWVYRIERRSYNQGDAFAAFIYEGLLPHPSGFQGHRDPYH